MLANWSSCTWLTSVIALIILKLQRPVLIPEGPAYRLTNAEHPPPPPPPPPVPSPLPPPPLRPLIYTVNLHFRSQTNILTKALKCLRDKQDDLQGVLVTVA